MPRMPGRWDRTIPRPFIPSAQVWSGCRPAHVRGWPPRPWPAWATAWPTYCHAATPGARHPAACEGSPGRHDHGRAGRAAVRTSRTCGRIFNIEVRQSMHLLGALVAPEYCRPTAPSSLPAELGDHLAEIASRPTGARQARHVGATLRSSAQGLSQPQERTTPSATPTPPGPCGAASMVICCRSATSRNT